MKTDRLTPIIFIVCAGASAEYASSECHRGRDDNPGPQSRNDPAELSENRGAFCKIRRTFVTGTSLVICSRTRTTSSTCGLKAKPVQVQAHPSPPGSNPGTDCTDLHRLSGGSVSCSCRTNARCSAPLPLGCDGSPGSAPYLCRSGCRGLSSAGASTTHVDLQWKPPQALFLVPHARLRCVAFSPFLAGAGQRADGRPVAARSSDSAQCEPRACEPAPVAEVAVRRSAETWPQSAVQRASDELRASKATKRSSRLQRRRARARSGAGVCQRARTPAQNGAFPLHCHRHSKALNPCTLEPFSPRVLLR